MALTTVLLDVGNTLLYEQPARHAIYAEEARARGLDIADGAMLEEMREAHHGLPLRVEGAYRYSDRWFARFIERIFVERLGLEQAALPELVDVLFARFQSPDTFRLFDGTLEFLDALAERGIARGVVSNWSARLPAVLEVMDLAPRLDFVVCSALEGCEKPEADIFYRALDRAGCSANEAVHCGDHPRNDGMAVQVGLRAVIVDHFGRRPGTELPRVGDFDELLAWIDEHRA